MKKIITAGLVLTLISLILLTACNKDDKSNPVSYVDKYAQTVSLTEAEGTSYTGDYFPIEEGYICHYSGSASIRQP